MFGKRSTPTPPRLPILQIAVKAIADRMDQLVAANEALEKDKQAMVHTIGALVLQLGGSVTIDPVYLVTVDTVESEMHVDGSVTLRAR